MSDLLPGVSHVVPNAPARFRNALARSSGAIFSPGCHLLSQPVHLRSQEMHPPNAHRVGKELERPTELQRGGNNEAVSFVAIVDSVVLQRCDLCPRTASLWGR